MVLDSSQNQQDLLGVVNTEVQNLRSAVFVLVNVGDFVVSELGFHHFDEGPLHLLQAELAGLGGHVEDAVVAVVVEVAADRVRFVVWLWCALVHFHNLVLLVVAHQTFLRLTGKSRDFGGLAPAVERVAVHHEGNKTPIQIDLFLPRTRPDMEGSQKLSVDPLEIIFEQTIAEIWLGVIQIYVVNFISVRGFANAVEVVRVG